jgi:GNAT superfamily N-acetyltransferase
MKIIYKEFKGDNVDFLKALVNELMLFQGDHAKIHPKIMSSMNYDNRLKTEYKGSDKEHMLVAYVNEKPIGFAYGTISEVIKDHLTMKPSWAKDLEGNGFYPLDYDTPKLIGTFKLLYVAENYRGMDIGKHLSDDLMTWLRSKNVKDLWVYVANGNEKVGNFYENYGFSFSHSVYGGFIDAYKQEL